jgi:outer membrane protein
MKAITVEPRRAGSAQLENVSEPDLRNGSVLVEAIAVGVCGTDVEIVEGKYGWAPPGETRLVLGHESLGRVLDPGPSSGLKKGDLVAGIVRRPDPVPCPNCAIGEWDMCRNGQYTEQSTIDGVKQAYYGILQTQSALESIQESITSYHELDRVTIDKVTQQVSLKNASLEVKTRLAKAEYEAINLSNDLATKKEQLNDLLGRDVRTDFRLNPIRDVSGFPADLESARNRALEQRPEIREARLKIKQAEVDRRIKKSEYIPDVTAGFIYMTFRNFDVIVPKNLANAGLAIKWEVFDWGRKRDELAEKDKTIRQAQERLREAEDRVLIDVSDKFGKLQQTRQALVVAQLAEETARETLRINTSQYKLTAALLSDVLQSQSTLAEANHQFQQALLDYWTAQAEFEKALGEDK